MLSDLDYMRTTFNNSGHKLLYYINAFLDHKIHMYVNVYIRYVISFSDTIFIWN